MEVSTMESDKKNISYYANQVSFGGVYSTYSKQGNTENETNTKYDILNAIKQQSNDNTGKESE